MMNKYSFASVAVSIGISAFISSCKKPAPSPEPGQTRADTHHSSSKLTTASSTSVNEDFRKTPPVSNSKITFTAPTIQEAKLTNGVRVLLVERHELPVVGIHISSNHGAEKGDPGVGAFFASMLMQGTKTRSSIALSDAFQKIGATYSTPSSFDSVGVFAQSLSTKFSELVTLLSDVVLNPAFDRAEIDRERTRRLTALMEQRDEPSVILSNTVAETLFLEHHPYHYSLLGTEASIKALQASDFEKFYAANFAPDTVTISIAGDISKDKAVAELERVFSAWKPKEPRVTMIKNMTLVNNKIDPRILIVDRPGATQSHVAVTTIGMPRVTKDFHSILVMNALLGGQFSSRLNMNLREKNAYTYGARSSFDMRHNAGPFTAGGAIVREKTDAAIREIFTEIERMQKELVTEEELADAKTSLIGQLPAWFETVGATSHSLAYLATHNLPLNEYAMRSEGYLAVTREAVKQVAETYLRPENLRVIVVGDAKVIESGLQKLNLGKVVVRAQNPTKG